MKPIKLPGENPIAVQRPQDGALYIEVHPLRALIGLVAGLLLCVTVVGLLAWGSQEASAFSAASRPKAPEAAINAPLAPSASYPSRLRKFYLDYPQSRADSAKTACAPGYHFASMWELMDPSNLQYAYNHPDAWTTTDSGQGPPGIYGWVRTGFYQNLSNTKGEGNCLNWTSNSSVYGGTTILLTSIWTTGTNKINDIWVPAVYPCNQSWPVWCIED